MFYCPAICNLLFSWGLASRTPVSVGFFLILVPFLSEPGQFFRTKRENKMHNDYTHGNSVPTDACMPLTQSW